MKRNIALRLPPRVIALIPTAVGVNLAIGQLAAVLHLPVFLDTVGTVVVAALVGPWVAMLTGLVSQLAFTVVSGNSTWLAFLPVHLGVALYAGFAAQLGVFRTTGRTVVAGLGLGALAALVSWPISLLLFGGVTGSGVTIVTTVLRGMGFPLEWAVFVASLSNDLGDKTVTFLLVRAVLTSLPRRLATSFPHAARAVGRA